MKNCEPNLEGDAQQKVKDLEAKLAIQENTINALNGEKRHFKAELASQEKIMHNLFNRCLALSGMNLCGFCGLRLECAISIKKYGVLIPTKEEAAVMLLKHCNKFIEEYEREHPEVVTDVCKE